MNITQKQDLVVLNYHMLACFAHINSIATFATSTIFLNLIIICPVFILKRPIYGEINFLKVKIKKVSTYVLDIRVCNSKHHIFHFKVLS